MTPRTALLACATSLIACLPRGDAWAQSLYVGSVERDGAELVLRACDLGAHRFRLVDAPGHPGLLRRELPQRLGTGRDQVVVSVVADYAEHEGRSVLSVSRIVETARGAPCRLMDALDERFRELEAASAAPSAPR